MTGYISPYLLRRKRTEAEAQSEAEAVNADCLLPGRSIENADLKNTGPPLHSAPQPDGMREDMEKKL